MQARAGYNREMKCCERISSAFVLVIAAIKHDTICFASIKDYVKMV